jgi:hypothetical protein
MILAAFMVTVCHSGGGGGDSIPDRAVIEQRWDRINDIESSSEGTV